MNVLGIEGEGLLYLFGISVATLEMLALFIVHKYRNNKRHKGNEKNSNDRLIRPAELVDKKPRDHSG